ncbi:MAG: flagellar hook-basal body complex protein FliE [Proteobacteria bacterium]|nr:flagellar hook-basal body complex protein FliE [Pseudomonadota bacterium]
MASELQALVDTVKLERADTRPAPSVTDRGHSFAERLKDFVAEVNENQAKAEHLAVQYAKGRQHDLHGTMIALQKADISFRLLSSVRTKVIEAYREISRMGA